MSEKEVAEIVGRYLEDKHPGGAMLEALAQGIRHEQDWWYVPVRPSVEPERRYEYYETLADVEAALEASEHLIVLLLPPAPTGESIVPHSSYRAEGAKEMTITLKPETEARLRERASRDGAELNELADTLLSNVLVDDSYRMTKSEIEASYRAMAADEEREAEAMEWAEGTLGHVLK